MYQSLGLHLFVCCGHILKGMGSWYMQFKYIDEVLKLFSQISHPNWGYVMDV